jgi:spermidine synthase
MRNATGRQLLLGAFTLSGFSGLIYESLWTHYLKLFLGHAAYAQTLVLAIFMGGLAIGSWICGRRSRGWSNLLVGYAVAEALIGAIALLFHPIFVGATEGAYSHVLPALSSTAAVTSFKWALAGMMILPQSVVLGMTFPLMAGGFIRRFPARPGASLALLYFCNSIGGAVGVLASGFLLVPRLGLPGTGMVAGLTNLALAATVWSVANQRATSSAEIFKKPGGAKAPAHAPYTLLLAVSLLTGTASFIYEIGWTRMLSLVLGSSTQAFELMLSAFILGLAFGGLWIRQRIDALTNPIRFLGGVQIGMGALALATLSLYGWLFPVMRWLVTELPKSDVGYLAFNFSSHALAMAIMLPATFLAGSTLPLITYTLVRAGYGESSIGNVYSANTVGAIVGVIFAVHVGLPQLGLKYLVSTGAALDMAVGVILLWIAGARTADRRVVFTIAAAAVWSGLILATAKFDTRLMASGVFRPIQGVLSPNSNVVFHRDGKTASVAVTDDGINVTIRTNGKVDASVNVVDISQPTGDEATQVLLGGLPLLLSPSARTAINIGFGSGMTTHVLLSAPSLERVDTVEIERVMVEGAERFHPRNARAYTDPRSHIIIDDAKTYFSTVNTPYDIIVSEPSNPWVSGTASLFSSEFYRLARRHLAPNGVFIQWLQLYEFDLDLVASVLKALGEHFDDYAIYCPSSGDIVIVGVAGRTVPDLPINIDTNPVLATDLARVDVRTLQDLTSRKIADRRLLEPWLETTPIRANSDFRPVLDHGASRARFLNTDARSFLELGFGLLPIGELLSGHRNPSATTELTVAVSSPMFPAMVATEIRDRLMNQRPSGRSTVWPRDRPSPARVAEDVLNKCRVAVTSAEQLSALVQLGSRVAAYLTPAELDALWPQVETLRCASNLPDRPGAWLRLFKAVGQRRPGEMASRAEALLADGSEPSSERRRYVVGAALLGHVTSGDIARARAVLLREGPSQVSAWSFPLTVIAGHVEARSGPTGRRQ